MKKEKKTLLEEIWMSIPWENLEKHQKFFDEWIEANDQVWDLIVEFNKQKRIREDRF